MVVDVEFVAGVGGEVYDGGEGGRGSGKGKFACEVNKAGCGICVWWCGVGPVGGPDPVGG